VPPALVSLLDELDDPNLVESIVRTYLRELPHRVEAIRQAVRTGSHGDLTAAMHLLKSTSAAVGANALSQLCANAERGLRDGGGTDAIDLDDLAREVTVAEADLHAAIARL
jgi:HPt (histidine-containing phosphotransfer) domain-containing protein